MAYATEEARRANARRYYLERRELISAQNKARRAERTEYMRAYRAVKAEKLRKQARERRSSDPEKQARYNANSSEWRAMRLQAMPRWLTLEQRAEIAAVYAEAKTLGLHVDHAVPLRGRTVWGLHVPWNLQLLTRAENCRKSNKL